MITMLECTGDDYYPNLLCFHFSYTLCNAEYRLSLERTLELSDDEIEIKEKYNTEHSHNDLDLEGPMADLRLLIDDESTHESEKRDGKLLPEKGGLENLNAQAKQHILQLQSRLDSMEKVTSHT
jgi:hypothetical protein